MPRKLLFSIILVLILTNIATFVFWKDTDKTSAPKDKEADEHVENEGIVASIGNQKISHDDWIEALKSDQGKKYLKNMVDYEVVKQLAESSNIKIHEKLVDREVALLVTMQGVVPENDVKQEEENLRKDIRHRFMLEALLTEDVSIPEDDIRTFYNNYQKQYNFSESVQFSHIIVENMETAEKVISELDQGASFQLLAQEYSTDEETRGLGGYLGFFSTTSQFVPSGYYDIAKEMDEHTYSEPFRVGNGVAIVYLHRMLPAYEFEYDEIKDHIRNELALNEIEQSLSADSLWDKLDVDWLYE